MTDFKDGDRVSLKEGVPIGYGKSVKPGTLGMIIYVGLESNYVSVLLDEYNIVVIVDAEKRLEKVNESLDA